MISMLVTISIMKALQPNTMSTALHLTGFPNIKIDGFRFDLSKGFTQTNTLGNTALWAQYDQSRINILERMATKIWQVTPDAYVNPGTLCQ